MESVGITVTVPQKSSLPQSTFRPDTGAPSEACQCGKVHQEFLENKCNVRMLYKTKIILFDFAEYSKMKIRKRIPETRGFLDFFSTTDKVYRSAA